jgi:hypothetical protein
MIVWHDQGLCMQTKRIAPLSRGLNSYFKEGTCYKSMV